MTIFSGNKRLIREVSVSALNPIGIVGMYTHFIADSTKRIAACKLAGVTLRGDSEDQILYGIQSLSPIKMYGHLGNI